MLRADDPSPVSRTSRPLDPASSKQLDEFVRRHRKQLARGITRHSGLRPQDRDEVFSDTMLGLCSIPSKLDPAKSPFSLAYTIALRKTRTKLKQLAAEAARTTSLPDDIRDYRQSGESQVDADERLDSVQRFLDGLDPIDRLILEARHFDELTWDGVADTVRLPKTSAIRRYRAIVDEARQTLAAWGS